MALASPRLKPASRRHSSSSRSLAGFALINRLAGNRVAARAEIEGLDVPEMGVLGYVGEETYAVRTAGQDFLATFGPGVPAKDAARPNRPPAPPRPDRPGGRFRGR